MHFALFLHIYQPPYQSRKLTRQITKESYEKIIDLLEEYPKAKITLNINASLTEQINEVGEARLLERMARLAEAKRIEFSASAAYHPILPDLPKREIARQINLNNSINQNYFGSAYEAKGFYPPEMAYDKNVGEVVKKLGYRWIIVDGTSILEPRRFLRWVYQDRESKALLFPRENEISYKIAFGRIRTVLGFLRYVKASECAKKQYAVLAMDGETFGHHQPKQMKFLKELLEANRSDRRINLATCSELVKLYPKRKSVEPVASTWGYIEYVDGQPIWVRWRNPENPAHSVLNELRALAIESVRLDDKKSREILDQALNSDTYWWCSAKPYWHPGMVKKGAGLFCRVVKMSKSATSKQKRRARYLCSHTLVEVMKRLRTRKQRERILGGRGSY